ncbi:MAG: hypothetical protein J5597_07705 [Spirochaetaceae bacterium]|nr:hypothetical protein [Spirochaetaceae bacterium]MBO7484882.1 hypothetical protein [Spirochaetaceae bacterium]MBP5329564.1 hypothetical protein [Spirochaetaceae bacterium]
MKVLELKNLSREESGLYYIRKFSAFAVLEIPLETIETPINFIIETGPTGKSQIDIEFTKPLSYPLLPVIKCVKEHIINMDREGKLP